jgi:hypothetical protein
MLKVLQPDNLFRTEKRRRVECAKQCGQDIFRFQFIAVALDDFQVRIIFRLFAADFMANSSLPLIR